MRGTVQLHIIYEDGHGVLRQVLRFCGQKWHLYELDAAPHDVHDGQVGVTMTLSGAHITSASEVFTEIDGIVAVLQAEDEPD
jgi:putative Mg2+ transporter-C (MgtC) family protein